MKHDHHHHNHHDERRWRSRGRGHGPGGFGPFGPGFGPGFGGRVRRGDLRGLLLAGLLDGPAHGYELMQRLGEKTGGRWKPSAGSVYPVLQQLEDEGLVRSSEQDGRRVYELTDTGREQADASALDDIGGDAEFAGAVKGLFAEVKQLHHAARQIAINGDPELFEQATTAVKTARQTLYKLLAEQ